MAIVKTNINYTYENMMADIHELNVTYPFLQVQFVGYSLLGRPIPIIKLGHGLNQIFYSASFHANEWITSVLLMKFIEDFCIAYYNNTNLLEYNIRYLFNYISLYLMPMVNPDGVDLVTGYYDTNSNIYKSFKNIASQYPDIPFPYGWKSNFNGVNFKKYQPVC